MKTIPLPMLRSVMFGNTAVVDLLEVHYSNQDDPDLRLAMFDRALTWDGHRYTPIGVRTPFRVRSSLQDQVGELQIVLPDVGAALATLLETADIAGTPALVRRVAMNDLASGRSMVLYRGRIKSPVTLEGTTATVTIFPRITDPDGLSSIPRRSWGTDCEVRFGGPECGVDLAQFRYSGEVGAGSGAVVIRDEGLTQEAIDAVTTKVRLDQAGNPVLSALPGVVIFDSGVNERQARPVASIDPCVITLAKPFYSVPAEGDQFRFERRCPKIPEACDGFGNFDNGFAGFPYVPREPRNLRRELLG